MSGQYCQRCVLATEIMRDDVALYCSVLRVVVYGTHCTTIVRLARGMQAC